MTITKNQAEQYKREMITAKVWMIIFLVHAGAIASSSLLSFSVKLATNFSIYTDPRAFFDTVSNFFLNSIIPDGIASCFLVIALTVFLPMMKRRKKILDESQIID